LGPGRRAEIASALHIGGLEALVVVPTHCSGQVKDGLAAVQQGVQGMVIVQVAADKFDTERAEPGGSLWIAYQGANVCAFAVEYATEGCANKTGGAGKGDQAATELQADATLRRTSSVTAPSLSAS